MSRPDSHADEPSTGPDGPGRDRKDAPAEPSRIPGISPPATSCSPPAAERPGPAARGGDAAGCGDRGDVLAGETTELVSAAQAGDEEALDALIARYYPRIHRIARVRLGPRLRQHMDSIDIVQASLVDALKTFDRFDMRDEASLINWLARIVEHRIQDAADYHTAQKRDHRREVPMEALLDGVGEDEVRYEPPASDTAPDDSVSRAEDLELVERALGELRSDYREIILARNYMGASWSQAASMLGSPSPDAARMLYARAMSELTRRLDDDG